MILPDVTCSCGNFIVHHSDKSGCTKIRAKVLLIPDFLNGKREECLIAVCRECGQEHVLPIKINLEKGPIVRHTIPVEKIITR